MVSLFQSLSTQKRSNPDLPMLVGGGGRGVGTEPAWQSAEQSPQRSGVDEAARVGQTLKTKILIN